MRRRNSSAVLPSARADGHATEMGTDVPPATARPRWWSLLEEAVCGVLLAAILVVVSIGVASRYVAHQPYAWTEPLARYLLIWLTMMGAAALVKQRAHIRIDFLHDLLPPTGQRLLAALALAVQLVVFVLLLRYGWLLAHQYTSGTTVPLLTQQHVYAAVPVGAALMVLHTARHLISELRGIAEVRQ